MNSSAPHQSVLYDLNELNLEQTNPFRAPREWKKQYQSIHAPKEHLASSAPKRKPIKMVGRR